MRVLLVADSLDVGGAERHVVGLAAGLARAGQGVVLAASIGGSLAEVASARGVPVHTLVGNLVKRRFSAAFSWQLTNLLLRDRFDVVHAHMYASATASALAALATRTPLLITEHSEASWRGPVARWLSRLAYARAQRIIAVSQGISHRLRTTDLLDPGRVVVIPNAEPDLPGEDLSWDASYLKQSPGQPLVGVVARLQPEKGIDDFLRAVGAISAELPDARFVIVGEGPSGAELRALARELGVHSHVHFLGFQPNGPEIVRQLDVLVVPSRSEGTPLVILEAMGAGVPVVATWVGGIPEQIEHGKQGLLVPPKQPSVLAAAVLRLLRDPTLAEALARNGRLRARSAFDHSSMVQATLALYREVVEAKVGPFSRVNHTVRL